MASESKFGPGLLGIALQGSFGHKYYALGILNGLQEKLPRGIRFAAGSGCVEMLLPLWLYFSKDKIRIREYFSQMVAEGQPRVPSILPGYDTDSLLNYGLSLVKTFQSPFNLRHAIANCSGPPGGFTFNRSYFDGEAGRTFEQLMHNVEVPVFTNALDARTFQEIYLYSGPLPKQQCERILGKKGQKQKRQLVELTVQEFMASGARAPFFAPIRVERKGAAVQYWMEGAMRCNPPLNPLIDVGVSNILLIRFFAKGLTDPQIDNQAELLNRYYDTVFTAPLEKELDFIEVVNHFVEKDAASAKKRVNVFDPSDEVKEFRDLLQNELDCLSHYQAADWGLWDEMFEKGSVAGRAIGEWCGRKGESKIRNPKSEPGIARTKVRKMGREKLS
jgi:predicted acylesterase/phospholipase RssA